MSKYLLQTFHPFGIIITITIRSMFKIPQNYRQDIQSSHGQWRDWSAVYKMFVFVQLIYLYVLCKSSLIGYHQGVFGPVWQVHQNDDIREPFEKRNYLKTFINPPPQPPYFP